MLFVYEQLLKTQAQHHNEMMGRATGRENVERQQRRVIRAYYRT